MQVNPGELKHRIKIFKNGEKDDDGFAGAPVLVKNPKAKFTRRTGTERESAGKEVQEAYVRFLIRYTSTPLDHEMFIEYKGIKYDIYDINDIGDRKEYIEIYCKERV